MKPRPLASTPARVRLALLTCCAAVLLPACHDITPTLPHAPRSSIADTVSISLPDVPPRGVESEKSFVHMNDEALWSLIEAADRRAIIGLKQPGQNRGEYRGVILISTSESSARQHALLQRPGVRLLEEDERSPVVLVELDALSTLAQLRQLPWIDYIEPAMVETAGFLQDLGCGSPSSSGAELTVTPGDIVSVRHQWMGVLDAWRRSSGRGVRIGLTDTGIYEMSDFRTYFLSGPFFPSGSSATRSVTYTHTSNYNWPFVSSAGCSHGTRMAGVMVAPRDGRGQVGVAWGADFVSVRFTTDPVQFDVWRARDAVRAAGNAGSHIFAIAWGTSDYFWDVLADEIRTWHYQAGRLFVAAAGTVPACYWFEHLRPFVVFPASMQEVQQVVALNDQHALHCSSHYGGYSALAAYIPTPTSGHGSNVWGMWGASGATATIAAAAALVWSRHPNREAVLQRLRDAGSHRHNQSISIGYGVPNVYAAVGGFTSLSISAPPAAAPYTEICATAVAKGDGPFTYLWHNGVTSREQCFQMGAVGESLTISVTVRDQVENFSRTATRTISVDGGNGTCKVCD